MYVLEDQGNIQYQGTAVDGVETAWQMKSTESQIRRHLCFPVLRRDKDKVKEEDNDKDKEEDNQEAKEKDKQKGRGNDHEKGSREGRGLWQKGYRKAVGEGTDPWGYNVSKEGVRFMGRKLDK